MSFPIGVLAFPACIHPDGSTSARTPRNTKNKDPKRDSFTPTTTSEGSSLKSPRSLSRSDSVKSLESPLRKVWRLRPSKRKDSDDLTDSVRERSSSDVLASPSSLKSTRTPQTPTKRSTNVSLSPSKTPLQALKRTLPRHIPIVIDPRYDYLSPKHPSSGHCTVPTPTSLSVVVPEWPSLSSPAQYSVIPVQTTPQYAELEAPAWKSPPPEQRAGVSLTTNISSGSKQIIEDRVSAAARMSHPTEVNGGQAPHERVFDPQSRQSSNVNLSSAHSSQVSLVGMRAEYESASETESPHHGENSNSRAPSRGGAAQSQTPATSMSNASNLVNNVHRTTGKRPPPLVGAATVILGDKLYVFGGRKLSRSRTHTLTANLYELNLISRHWTKLDPKGDVPQPRYFHSVCALGDRKLVCYGGMAPAPPEEPSAEAQPEVIVMSDVHFFDTETLMWTKIATRDAPQGRYAHCATILPSTATFASRDAPMSAVHHNPAGANPNQGSLGVSIDGTGGAEMVIVGGQDSANHYIEQVSVFNLRSLKWTGTTGMGRSCGAYRSVVTPLTSMSNSKIGAGEYAEDYQDDDDEEEEEQSLGSGAPMLIYSNFNFLDVKLELQVRLPDGTLTEKPMRTEVSPPGLRFPNGGIIGHNFVVSGTLLTSSKQEYAIWTLDLRTLTWSRIDPTNNVFESGSWNRGVLWSRRNTFVILGDRKRVLIDDYNNRRINFSNICLVELETFGLYENPRAADPTSNFISASAPLARASTGSFSRLLGSAAQDLGTLALNVRELADMDFLAIDGTKIPVNSRLIARRWGPHFITLLRDSLATASDTETATLRPSAAGHPSRNSSITITPSFTSGGTTLTTQSSNTELPDTRVAPASMRPRLFFLPHTAPTLQALLHYLYTSSLPSSPSPLATPQIFCSLLQLARPYKIDGLFEAIVARLHDCLDGRNAAAIFNAAAMAAGGGDGPHFVSSNQQIRQSDIPVRTASLGGIDSLLTNGAGGRGVSSLRIDTEMANGRTTRNTVRPGQSGGEETDEEEVPGSAATDASMSDTELASGGQGEKGRRVWHGTLSPSVGLQKRALRGLVEGRRMQERRRHEGVEGARAGLGIA